MSESAPSHGAFTAWLDALQTRHTANLAFAEITRGLRALSSGYVERRGALSSRSALDGAGKRAAFALFYGPLHWLVTDAIARSLALHEHPFRTIIDLGSGTGAAAAALALTSSPAARLTGVDQHPWAVAETRWTYRTVGLAGTSIRADVSHARLSGAGTAILAAFLVNELTEPARERLLQHLLRAFERGAAVLIVEPIARAVTPWWDGWSARFERTGGRADEWRFGVELPPAVGRLDHAAGLDHRTLTARSLWLPPGSVRLQVLSRPIGQRPEGRETDQRRN